MKKHSCLWYLTIFTLFLGSCAQYAYYQSPFQSNTASYKSMPLYSDSIRNATYAHAAFTTGGANSKLRDELNGGIASVYRTHTTKHIQAFYGITGMVGNYHIRPYEGDVHNRNLDTFSINKNAGAKLWGGWGATGGISLNLPFDKHEFRLGTELTWQHEFGQFVDFRKQLPGSAANLIDTRSNHITAAISTDLVFHINDGAIGFKFLLARPLHRLYGFNENRAPYDKIPAYFAATFHLTFGHVTGFMQGNFGTYSSTFQMGLNYRLSRK